MQTPETPEYGTWALVPGKLGLPEDLLSFQRIDGFSSYWVLVSTVIGAGASLGRGDGFVLPSPTSTSIETSIKIRSVRLTVDRSNM